MRNKTDWLLIVALQFHYYYLIVPFNQLTG